MDNLVLFLFHFFCQVFLVSALVSVLVIIARS